MAQQGDFDPEEAGEWLQALESVIEHDGVQRAQHLRETLIDRARRAGANLSYRATTAYVNTIHLNDEARNPGDKKLE